jgi:peptide-methionine (R)-S-oxide reductase
VNDNLTDEQKAVLFDRATERPGTGKYLHYSETGMYTCANCGNELFASDTKFEATNNTGWPSFYDVANSEAVELKYDNRYGMERTEAVCKKCGGHLGHVFDDGPSDRTGVHYCINSASLDFKNN